MIWIFHAKMTLVKQHLISFSVLGKLNLGLQGK